MLFHITLFHINADEPLIKAKIFKNNTVRFYLSTPFTQKYVRQPLLLSYPQEINLESLPPSIVEIPLITHVIPVIWFSGQVYTIEEMDEDLYHSLVKIKAFFKRFFYNTSWEGELKPERLVKNIPPKIISQPAALFSGGLDSTTTVFRHFDEDPILISFNDPHKDSVNFARSHHLDFYTIGINHNDFLKLTFLNTVSCDISKWFWDTSMGLSWVGAAAPFLYAKGIPVLYIPSAFAWHSFIFPDGQTLYQPASPLIDENLSPMGLRVYHDPFTMTRIDKIKLISSFCLGRNISKPKLVVCNHHKKSDTTYSHCNRCMKCRITMLNILAIGESLQDYGFSLSEEEFISQFQSYIIDLKMRRGGTYIACYDTQTHLKANIETLPLAYRSFYEWFASIDLSAMIDNSSHRPLRETSFDWNDYKDLYPEVENFVDNTIVK